MNTLFQDLSTSDFGPFGPFFKKIKPHLFVPLVTSPSTCIKLQMGPDVDIYFNNSVRCDIVI